MADTSNIRMSPEEMNHKATEFESSGEDYVAVVNRMSVLVKNLCEEWAGQSSAAFEQQFEDLRPSFQQTEQLIQSIATQLREVSQAMQQADQDIASRVGVR